MRVTPGKARVGAAHGSPGGGRVARSRRGGAGPEQEVAMTQSTRAPRSVVLAALGVALAGGMRAVAEDPPTVHVGSDEYSTIQAAVDAALPGDTVRIGPGVWTESVSVTFDDPDDLLTIDARD